MNELRIGKHAQAGHILRQGKSRTLAVAAFHGRVIAVYEGTDFQELERFEHVTNDGDACLYQAGLSYE